MRVTFHGEVKAISEGTYTTIVFKNLEVANDHYYRFITITVPPNWNYNGLRVGDKGYIEYDAICGGDEYFKSSEGKIKQYNYSQYYFVNFIKEQEQIINKEFKF